MILGIVLAGGNAERWNGYPKEMLPIDNGFTLLDRTIEVMRAGGVDRIMFMTNKEKASMHINHLGNQVDYRVRDGIKDIWHSITDSFSYGADWNYYAMPDTYFPADVFKYIREKDFNIGWFLTSKSERFGVIKDNQIIDKQKMLGTYHAWGVLCWTKKVVEFWKEHPEIVTHTEAFNLAMREFDYHEQQMSFYYDMASWEDYKKFFQSEYESEQL